MFTSVGQQIIADIQGYIFKHGGAYSNWYVGISNDARKRLFEEHFVRENFDAWIFATADSADEARWIESYFVNDLKTDGGTGGGDYTSKMVYAYKKSSYTKP